MNGFMLPVILQIVNIYANAEPKFENFGHVDTRQRSIRSLSPSESRYYYHNGERCKFHRKDDPSVPEGNRYKSMKECRDSNKRQIKRRGGTAADKQIKKKTLKGARRSKTGQQKLVKKSAKSMNSQRQVPKNVATSSNQKQNTRGKVIKRVTKRRRKVTGKRTIVRSRNQMQSDQPIPQTKSMKGSSSSASGRSKNAARSSRTTSKRKNTKRMHTKNRQGIKRKRSWKVGKKGRTTRTASKNGTSSSAVNKSIANVQQDSPVTNKLNKTMNSRKIGKRLIKKKILRKKTANGKAKQLRKRNLNATTMTTTALPGKRVKKPINSSTAHPKFLKKVRRRKNGKNSIKGYQNDGSVTQVDSCNDNEYVDKDDNCVECPDGQIANDDQTGCITDDQPKSDCPEAQVRNSKNECIDYTCEKNEEWYINLDKCLPRCKNNLIYLEDTQTCGCDFNAIEVNDNCEDCPDGQVAENDKCVPDEVEECKGNQVLKDGQCTDCPKGYIIDKGGCVKPEPVEYMQKPAKPSKPSRPPATKKPPVVKPKPESCRLPYGSNDEVCIELDHLVDCVRKYSPQELTHLIDWGVMARTGMETWQNIQKSTLRELINGFNQAYQQRADKNSVINIGHVVQYLQHYVYEIPNYCDFVDNRNPFYLDRMDRCEFPGCP